MPFVPFLTFDPSLRRSTEFKPAVTPELETGFCSLIYADSVRAKESGLRGPARKLQGHTGGDKMAKSEV